ncbi:MAG: hypothetical protein A6F71_05935 [Cycloclasticus sp. symbiont of Poecilosclerida sp. M]|nr:MAG: hypothetical protein A6F71_05935 [Cycloclasticus sp. symbiont of Poecilosclerida sp. M]
MNIKISLGLAISLFCVQQLFAEDLLQTEHSWDGGEIAYPSGPAQITSFILALKEGQKVGFHCHPVPTMGYVLKGQIAVETMGGKKVALKQGEAVVEVMRTLHQGHALGGDAEILVFYAGATDMPNTLMATDEGAKTYCRDDSGSDLEAKHTD